MTPSKNKTQKISSRADFEKRGPRQDNRAEHKYTNRGGPANHPVGGPQADDIRRDGEVIQERRTSPMVMCAVSSPHHVYASDIYFV